MSRLMLHLTSDEQREFYQAAERNRRDVRDEIVLLALKGLREDHISKQRLASDPTGGVEVTDKVFYGVAELAAESHIPKRSIYDAVSRGEIKALRIGRSIYIPRAEVERLLGDNPNDDQPTAPSEPNPTQGGRR